MDSNEKYVELVEDEKYLMVTRKEYFPILFSYKNKHPQLNIKFIDKQEFASMISFSFAKDPIPLLLKQGIDYSNAKKYVHIFLFGNLEKNAQVKQLFESIPSDYISYDEYGFEELNRYDKIIFFEMGEDTELKLLANRKGIKFDEAKFENLHFDGELIEDKFNKDNYQLIYFKNKFLQYTYIYSNIRKLLIDDPSLQDRIAIINDGGEDLYYINYCSEMFGIKTMLITQRKLLTIDSIREKVRNIFTSKSFAFSDKDEQNNDLKLLKNIIDKYELKSLTNFDFAYSCLTEIINQSTFNQIDSRSGITATSCFNLNDRNINYITNFKHDVFYKIYSDNDVLSDKELEELGVNTSYVKTAIDKRFKRNYLRYSNNILLSRVTQHLSEKIFDSEFIEEMKLKEKIKPFDYSDVDEMLFTENGAGIYVSYILDNYFCKTIEKLDYKTYDHSYKQIDGKILSDDKNFSLTNLEKYIDCPFAYLLKQILPTNDFDPRNRYKGDLIHKLCENIFDKNYDFEAEWSKAVQTYKDCFKNENVEYKPYDDAILKVFHAHLKRIIPLYVNHATEMDYVDSIAELPVYFSLKDDDGNSYKFSGKIDKIVKSKYDEDGKNKTFWTIIDYKTGSESFDIYSTPYGRSVQLPLYYYALMSIKENGYPSDSFKYPLTDLEKTKNLIDDGAFGGFGIQHVYGNSLSGIFKDDKNTNYLSENAVKKNSVIKGITLYNSEYFKSFDITIVPDKKGNLKSGTYLNISTKFSDPDAIENIIGNKSELEKYNLMDVVEDSIKGMINAIKGIKNNKFEIAPTCKSSLKDKIGENNRMPCDYCQYKDICYHNILDRKDYSKEIKQHFKLKGAK